MARQVLTKLTMLGNFPSLPLTANSADLPMTAAIAADKERFVMDNKNIVIAHNTGAGARTVTITSVANAGSNRTGDITAYSIGAGEYAAFGPFEKDGWQQSDGYFHLEAEHAEVKFGILKLA